MKCTITSDDEKKIVCLLMERQPRTLDEFAEIGKRRFELTKLLKSLEDAKVIIRESGSGKEKYWLNEAADIAFLGRDTQQSKRLKHPKKRKKTDKSDVDDSIYR